MAIRKFLNVVGEDAAAKTIRINHAVETGISATRKAELEKQLTNPNAGVLAHLKVCHRCASDVEARAKDLMVSSGVTISPAAPEPVTA